MEMTDFRQLFELNKKAKAHGAITTEESIKLRRLIEGAEADIARVDDDNIRFALAQRYIYAERWRTIADDLGHYTDDTVRKECDRAVRRLGC